MDFLYANARQRNENAAVARPRPIQAEDKRITMILIIRSWLVISISLFYKISKTNNNF